MQIRPITRENARDLNLPNEPFSKPGQFIPSLENGIWRYRETLYPAPETETFPEEHYEFDTLSQDCILFAAYEAGACIGVAVYRKAFFKYLYLCDLKVSAAHRRKGAGKALIMAGLKAAQDLGCRGIYTQAQDNNLNACRFYVNCGFQIGGFDNRVYTGTSQQGKADIIFYLDEEDFYL